MAQYDTGLGWSAKDTYIETVAGTTVGVVGSIYWNIVGFETQTVPVTGGTFGDVLNNGLIALSADTPSTTTNRSFLVGASESGVLVARKAGAKRFSFISTKPGVIAYGIYALRSDMFYSVALTEEATFNGIHMYYAELNIYSGPSTNPYVYVPEYPSNYSVTIIMNNIYMNASTTFTKLKSGVCTAAYVTYNAMDGTVKKTPVLISTLPLAVDMSDDGSTVTSMQKKIMIVNNGMKFYMSYIDVDPLPDISSELDAADLSNFPVLTTGGVFQALCRENWENIIVLETVDPYGDFGNSGEDAGETDPDPDDDDIEEDDLPTTSFASAGFCRIYRPSLTQINDLSNYMWTDQTFLQTVINHLKQILENPIDSIISLSLVPCVPSAGTDVEVKVMYIPTGVYMPPVLNQFVEVDCGSFALKEMYGSALDYNPYTSVQLYLPYIGIVQLDTDEVMGKTIHVGYRIDVVTGVCCAYVKAGSDVLYQFSGHCSIQQPITSADFSSYVNAALAAGKLVASIAAAGAGAPAVAATLAGAPTPSISGTSSETRMTTRNEATGRQITAGTRTHESVTENPGASFGEIAARGVSNTVGAVMNSKTVVQHSGGFSGNSGYLAAVRRPYLIITRPRIANPEQYGQFNGRPSMIYMNLGSCTGYTQVQSIHLTGIDATNPELSEITTLLTSGVIF